MARPLVVILSTADYDAAVWTNKQHIAKRLAAYADVHYVNSLGLRRPKVNVSDVVRLWRRLRRRSDQRTEAETDGVHIIDPILIPFHQFGLVRRVNRVLFSRRLRNLPLERATLWTFSPLSYGLEWRAKTVVYHSVDLLHTVPGIPEKAVLAGESTLVKHADVVIASSSGVKSHLNELGRRDVVLWPNVADTELYAAAARRHQHRKKRAIFAGNFTSTKVDFDLLRAIAEAGIELALAGPVSIDGSRDRQKIESLLQHSGVVYLGNLSPEQLADECAKSMVGLIPYLDNAYTAGVFPMKLYEYLAAGEVVVATPIRSLREVQVPGLLVCPAGRFPAVIARALEEFDSQGALERQGEAMAHSWESRLGQVLDVLRSASK